MLHFDDGLEFLDKWRCLFFDASWPWLKNETKVFFSDKLKKGHFSSDFFFNFLLCHVDFDFLPILLTYDIARFSSKTQQKADC